MSQSPRLYRSPSEGSQRRHLGKKKKTRESARVQTPTSAKSATCGCRARPTWPVTRPAATTETLQSSNAAIVEPSSSGRMQSTATRGTTVCPGTGATATTMATAAATVPRRTRGATFQRAVEEVWGPWGVGCSAGRAEGAYHSWDLRSQVSEQKLISDLSAFPPSSSVKIGVTKNRVVMHLSQLGYFRVTLHSVCVARCRPFLSFHWRFKASHVREVPDGARRAAVFQLVFHFLFARSFV